MEELKTRAASLFARTGWLAKCPPSFREEIIRRSRPIAAQRDELVQRAGDLNGGLFGLVEGSVTISIDTPEFGAHAIHVARPGFWIGEGATFRRHPRHVSVTAADPSFLLALPQAQFDAMVLADPGYWQHFTMLALEHIDMLVRLVADVMTQDPVVRVGARLVGLHRAQSTEPGPDGYELRLSQAELAMMSNLSRKTVNQILQRLSRTGALSVAYGRLTIRDLGALEKLATVTLAD